ncbi:MAG TPA: porin family protein [Nitrosomonas sp.]|nr:porin family protein [Nitrosomonas sp.]
MKHIIVIVIISCVLLFNESKAQLIKTYGVKLAYTAATENFDPKWSPNVKYRQGVNAAVFAEWLNFPVFSIISQIEYAQRGAFVDYLPTQDAAGPEHIIWTEHTRVDYLSIPLFAKFSIPMGTLSPFIALGPKIDILLGHRSDEGHLNYIYDQFNNTTLGGTFSIGGQMKSGLPFSVILEGRFNFDFQDSYSSDGLKIRNTSIDIWLGLAL